MRELRPHQIACNEAVITEYNKGITRPLVTIFTGGGKTFTLIELLERMGFKRVLWLSFQQELIDQSGLAFIRDKWPDRFEEANRIGFLNFVKQNSIIGCIKADLFKIDAEVTLGSVMTVYNRLDRFPADYFDCVVCDEAHLFMSKSAHLITTTLKPKLLIGATATATRADGLPLSDIFQKIVYDYDLGKGIRDGWACEMDAVRIKTNISLDKVKTTAGEFNAKDLTNEINTLSRNQQIVDSYKKYLEGRSCIAFCVDIKHAMDLAEQFRMNGYDCQAVSSNEELTPDRSENIGEYKTGKLKIISNVNILTCGFDYPDTGGVIMAAPTKSLTRYLQAVGRGSRLKSKEYVSKFGQNCIIIDVVDVTTRHNLVNAWELDKEKEPEDRVFISQEKREKLLAARKAKLEHERKEDEYVKLLSLPKVKISNSWRMSEDATELQLNTLRKWNYPTDDVHYTKQQVAEIFGQQPCGQWAYKELKEWGYSLTPGQIVSVAQHQLAKKEYESRNLNKKSKV